MSDGAISNAYSATERVREIVICSAIRLHDGRVFRCHRHHDGLRTVRDVVESHQTGAWEQQYRRQHEQGFVTSRNRFVSRAEGLLLQTAAGIPSARVDGYGGKLFSEDLY